MGSLLYREYLNILCKFICEMVKKITQTVLHCLDEILHISASRQLIFNSILSDLFSQFSKWKEVGLS